MKSRRISAVLFSVLFVLSASAYGNNNTIIGDNAGEFCDTCNYDTFMGAYSGRWCTSGQWNTYVGYNVGIQVNGNYNTFIGAEAGYGNSSANYNTFVGSEAGRDITSGEDNVFLGYQAGLGNHEGSQNTFVGVNAGFSSAAGGYDVFLGESAGYYNHGSWNTFVGALAGQNNYTGNGNVFIGHNAGSSETGSNMLYIDNCNIMDGSGNCTQPLIKGTFDNPRTVSIDGALTVTGTITSMAGGSSGSTYFGQGAGNIGWFETFVGNGAEHSTTTGEGNSFIGSNAGNSNTQGEGNSFFGAGAGEDNKTGSQNTYIGSGTALNHTSGDNNTFLGWGAGSCVDPNTTGSGNVFLGYQAGCSETGSNKLYIDNCYTGSSGGYCAQPLIKGDFQARSVKIDGTLTMVTVATPSDRRYKKEIHPLESSLDKVLRMQGVSFEWDREKVYGAGYRSGRQIGLIAQEVEKVLPELVQTDDEGYKTLSYDKVTPVLVEAIKEQQKQIKERDARIERLEEELAKMERRLASLETSANTVAMK
jgi:hypothetical protein